MVDQTKLKKKIPNAPKRFDMFVVSMIGLDRIGLIRSIESNPFVWYDRSCMYLLSSYLLIDALDELIGQQGQSNSNGRFE